MSRLFLKFIFMPNNIISGPNSVVALAFADGIDLDDVPGINATTIHEIYEVDGKYRSWQPGRTLNQFNVLRKDIGYLIIAKQGLDLGSYFAPPGAVGTNSVFVIGDGMGNVIGDGAGNLIGYSN